MTTKYSIGQKWYVDHNDHWPNKSFTFVIIGKGMRPGYKHCRLEYDDPTYKQHEMESEYSHKHLNKYAKHVESK